MIPLVCDAAELKFVKNIVDTTAQQVMEQYGEEIEYKVGAMVEIPRAALTIDVIIPVGVLCAFLEARLGRHYVEKTVQKRGK